MMPSEVDVVVVGSGGAGLTAALSAAVAGAEVALFEAAPRWGGATAISGGQVWVPNNHRMSEFGVPESHTDALTYCTTHSPDREPELIEAFLQAAPRMARFLEEHAPLRWSACGIPDSFAEHPGGRSSGRHLEVLPVELAELGSADDLVWPAPYPMVLTNAEIGELDLTGGARLPMDLIERRTSAGETTMGLGLVVGLMRGCTEAGVALHRQCRVQELHRDADRVRGVTVADASGQRHRVSARRAVLLANGGYEWDGELAARLHGGVAPLAVSPPVNRGDALRLAATAGAALARTSEGWFWPVFQVPGETWSDGSPRARLVLAERGRPHTIWVNRAGQRFVNESSHNCALAFSDVDSGTLLPANLPAWVIGDARFRERSPVAGVAPAEPAPDWLVEADSLAELAQRAGIDETGLLATVERFNQLAGTGVDTDFGRGAGPYDHGIGDPSAPHPNLGSIERPPFFAAPIRRGTVGTKGGPLTDVRGQVVAWDGTPIAGLYAAGNAAASVLGPGIIAPGLTLGLALTWGWLAGRAAAGAPPTPAS
ncbi:succinate dehydrogenase/fumarate reductase flavoprotein subunit [Tamaricihabitans halophyticus]|uniref:Succinate dehydrogenase/fumarate reductase flavoprotein subunit n=1 Tax=Tamaricihabitans halophyticus TaxID=1262583 RepID=A0A4R2QKN1_9PSEU|nr:FAD-dependent oxidoreductase [Tamaricihabitans halophyticus]TCP50000.1 succinate dehydrogenase/fumarate reductase flavoprotein subunit [Tamaricihabitans halophyticus]